MIEFEIFLRSALHAAAVIALPHLISDVLSNRRPSFRARKQRPAVNA